MNERYLDTVRLLLRCAPVVFNSDHFALKGGTAINLFMQEMPRLSVDLDLVYLNHIHSREEALATIKGSVQAMREKLEKMGLKVVIGKTNEIESKIFIKDNKVEVKVEINYVMRGTVFPVIETSISEGVKNRFKMDLVIPVLAKDELYASKFVAAMDRQHPRDLYDVNQFLKTEIISERMMTAFVGYVVCHPRPIHEILFGNMQGIDDEYDNHFVGMTEEEIPLQTLLDTRTELFKIVPASLTISQKNFLLSVAKADPDWALIDIPHLKEMPAMKWKLENLNKLKLQNSKKLDTQANELEKNLS